MPNSTTTSPNETITVLDESISKTSSIEKTSNLVDLKESMPNLQPASVLDNTYTDMKLKIDKLPDYYTKLAKKNLTGNFEFLQLNFSILIST